MELLRELWPTIKETIQKEYNITDLRYNLWILPLELTDVVDNKVIISIPSQNPSFLEYMEENFREYFENTISELLSVDYQVKFILKDSEYDLKPYREEVSSDDSDTDKSVFEKARLNPKYTFDTFVVGGYNKFAHSASLAVAENPGHVYNPLYLYGGPGLGKTHLMHSIGHEILKKNRDAHVLYVTSEEFTNEVIESIRSSTSSAMTRLREKYRTVDVLMIDDIQFIIGKESTQEEFFNTFNALYAAEKQIIITSDKPPKEMDTLDERYRSRFSWGMIADINMPDYETRMAILRKKSEHLNKKIDDSIIQYIANNITSNIRDLEGALNKILAFSRLNNIPITQSVAEEALKDMISPHQEKQITPEIILQVVCDHYNVSEQSVLSSKKTRDIAMTRQIIMYLCREYINDMSLKQIAEFLGKKDHTTIMHGIEKVENDMQTDARFKNNIETIKKKLTS
ncbi:MAG: chromosomal replication initiator protein DnaA [Lachnospiraceae bacterium]|nr:chromosomal replication initiator protein DnaA [Lachnospiraceae bacterium]